VLQPIAPPPRPPPQPHPCHAYLSKLPIAKKQYPACRPPGAIYAQSAYRQVSLLTIFWAATNFGNPPAAFSPSPPPPSPLPVLPCTPHPLLPPAVHRNARTALPVRPLPFACYRAGFSQCGYARQLSTAGVGTAIDCPTGPISLDHPPLTE
jgi:hypothetical protein